MDITNSKVKLITRNGLNCKWFEVEDEEANEGKEVNS
jgi:hypothetical protein